MRSASRLLLPTLALLISVLPLVRCQSTDAGLGTVVSIEPDSAYAGFGRLWVGMVGADNADTLVLFNDSLADTNALRRIPVEGISEGKTALVIRGYESGSGKLVYEEVRLFDTRTSRLLSEPLRQVIRGPRLALRVSDTLLSIGDTLSLVGTLGDTDGVIRSYAWDFRGDGRFGPSYAVEHPSDTLEAWSVYPDTGRFTVVLQALDGARKAFRASLPIQVVLDPPSADAGGDLEVVVGDTVRLRGTAADALGRVVRREWSFGGADFIEVGDGDTAFAAPAEAGEYPARFRATDDDGLRAVDSMVVRVRYSADASLADLRLSSGMLAPAFAPDRSSFSATVPYSELSLGIHVVRGESHAVVTVAGRELAASDTTVQVPLQVGGNDIAILVLAQDGRAQRRYDLSVTRSRNDDASLRSLAVNPGSLSPPFHRDSLLYRVTLEHGHETFTMLPIASDNVNARILVGETPVPSGTASPARAVRVGLDTVVIKVLGHDEISSRTYQLRVRRLASADATLKSLDLSTGPLEPPFAAGIFQYADTVAHAVARVALKPVLSNPSAQVRVAGKPVVSGAWSDSLPLAPGDNTLSAKVLAQNGDSAEYSVLLRRRSADARLASLTVSEGRLEPPFSAGILAFRDTVESRVERLTLRAEAVDAAARLVLHDGLPATGPAERVLPLVSGSNPFLIIVLAEEGNVDTVRLTVFRKRSRDTSLSALEPSSGSLVPPFTAAVRSYQMTLPNAATSLAFRPTAAHSGSRIFVSGKEVASGVLSLPLPLAEIDNAFLVRVVAESGDSGFYRVAVRRRSVNADLASLTVGEGTLSPAFDPARDAYVDTVPTMTESLVVNARAADRRVQSITLHGRVFPGDSAGATLPLSPGPNAFDIKVRSEDGGERTYTLRAYRRRGFLRNLGGTAGGAVLQLPDKGYIVLGSTSAGGASDIYLVRTDANGNPLPGWPRTYTRSGSETGVFLKQSPDGGFEISGWAMSTGATTRSIYVLRTGPDGIAMSSWPKVSGAFSQYISDINPTLDGGFILAGPTFGGDDSVFLVKTDAEGNISSGWPKHFREERHNSGYAVQQLGDGGYFVTSTTGNASDDHDVFLIRTDASGAALPGWPKSYSNYLDDQVFYGTPTRDGGFIAIGVAETESTRSYPLYLLRTDAKGERLPGWPKVYSLAERVTGVWVEETRDGGFIFIGSPHDTRTGHIVCRINAEGAILPGWPKTYTGFWTADRHSVKQTADGGFILSGRAAGGGLLLLKIDADGNWE